MVKISKGNSKLGKGVWNVSLSPVITCAKGVPCAKSKTCYAMKLARIYKPASAAWAHNYNAWRACERAYFADIRAQLTRATAKGKAPRFFRWHVSGDFPTPSYLAKVQEIARDFPAIRFLAFTKRYGWASAINRCDSMPANLAMVLSAWPGLPLDNPSDLPVAYMRDEANPDSRIPADALECPGGCESCGMCWHLGRNGVPAAVVFDRH